MNAAAGPVVEAVGITKRFGGLTALGGVDFALRDGEVHALVGENGAGKSTLMSILYGVLQPDSGTLRMHGAPVRFRACADAMHAGIGMVFQHFLLVDRFTVARNVLLGREPSRHGLLDERAADAAVAALAARYGFALDPRARVEDLGVGARQQVELLKVLEREARVVILDEPTASLSPPEAAALLEVVRRMRSEGRAIAYVSHKLREVLDIADRITVLRAGKVVGSMPASHADESTLAQMMIGRRVDPSARLHRSTTAGAVVLEVSDVRCSRDDGAPALAGITLSVSSGEIVGIAGVDGNGQLEFAECIYGLRRPSAGLVMLDGRDVTTERSIVRRRLGMRYIPPDRIREGLIVEFDAVENVALGDQREGRSPLLDVASARDRAAAIARDYALERLDPALPVASFSGGMQQKLIAGRELGDGAKLAIVYSPTRGVDVGAAEIIYTRLRQLRDAGAAIVLISYDLDEIRALSDRIVVFASGRIAGTLSPEEADDTRLGRLMGGVAARA